jgi:CDP-diacylglycerol--glycerol-3-phosphate 3-phosphatidyltransferase
MSNHDSTGSLGQKRWRHLPNAISLARLGAVPVLFWLAVIGREEVFTGLLLLALASDLVDGWLARRLGVVSARGALLDSVGDMAVTLAILWGIWWLHAEVFDRDGWIIYSLLCAWLLAHCASVLRYGRLASYHTWLIRVGIAAFNFFAITLFLFGYQPWLLYLSATLSTLGVIEHFLLLWRLPEWTPNIPGGIFRIWRSR